MREVEGRGQRGRGRETKGRDREGMGRPGRERPTDIKPGNFSFIPHDSGLFRQSSTSSYIPIRSQESE